MCFMLLFRDLIRLFASYNDAIINLLEKFFEMNKKQAREALELYKKFLVSRNSVIFKIVLIICYLFLVTDSYGQSG